MQPAGVSTQSAGVSAQSVHSQYAAGHLFSHNPTTRRPADPPRRFVPDNGPTVLVLVLVQVQTCRMHAHLEEEGEEGEEDVGGSEASPLPPPPLLLLLHRVFTAEEQARSSHDSRPITLHRTSDTI
jgi:hypothetical protein